MEAFDRLQAGKKNAILNAGFTAFGKNGYKKTSMADAAELAGVSKASLFHYFQSKLSFYVFLYKAGIDFILGIVLENPYTASDDFFVRIIQAQEMKVTALTVYPGLLDFLTQSYLEETPEVRESVNNYNQAYRASAFSTLMQGVNWDKFKPGIQREMIINAVRWVSEGCIRSALGKKSTDEMVREVSGYLDLLRTTFYKEEYLREHT